MMVHVCSRWQREYSTEIFTHSETMDDTRYDILVFPAECELNSQLQPGCCK